MNAAEFYDTIDKAIRRPRETARIPFWARRACRRIEQQGGIGIESFSWMRKYGEIELDPEATDPHQISFPNTRVKFFFFGQLFETLDGGGRSIRNLTGVSPEQITSIDQGDPGYYWLDGTDYLWLDGRVLQPRMLRLHWAEYTDWPTDETQSPAIIDRAEDLLYAETLISAAQELRDPRMIETYAGLREQALRALSAAEVVLEQKHVGDMALRYVPPR